MEAGQNSDRSIFGWWPLFNVLTAKDFDSIQLIEEERAESVAVVYQEGNEERVDESGDQNLPLFYTRPSFQWTSRNYVPLDTPTRTSSNIYLGLCVCSMSLEQRWIIFSCTIWTQFKKKKNLSSSQMTLPSMIKKRKEQPDMNKGKWKALTLEKIKVNYGLLIMKDMIRLDRCPLLVD